MARGVQFLSLIEQLRAEARHSTLLSVGTDSLPYVKQILRRTQETLADEHDWSFLRVKPYLTLSAGERYYDVPNEISVEQIDKIVCWQNGVEVELERGIGSAEYAVYDSDDDVRSDPALKWDIVWTGESEQIEIWPIPASGLRLQLFGRRPLRPLVANEDVCDLDDKLIVLFAAAEVLAGQKSKDSEMKLQLAQKRLMRLKATSASGSSMFQMGLGNRNRGSFRTVVRVRGG
jgi:hypothetical protein